MNRILDEALKHIDVTALSFSEWLSLGIAIKNEGYDCSVWDDLSKKDVARYMEGDCEHRWQTFREKGEGDRSVTGGTIVRFAKLNGWSPDQQTVFQLDFDDSIIDYQAVPVENDYRNMKSISMTQVEQLRRYIHTLFDPGDYIGFVTGDVYQNEEGRWVPRKGVCSMTAADILELLDKYPDDIGAAIGDWKEEAGAWIRINPLDGKGVKNQNVTAFRFALVECDSVSVREQLAAYIKYQLPIAALVHSGGKSLHAVVKIDAASYEEYNSRVRFLYDYLSGKGLKIDMANRNPSRLTRMPGVTRNGKVQALIAVDIGRKTWDDWYRHVRNEIDEMPDIVPLSRYIDDPPEPPKEIIQGVLRKGHKMLVSAASKSAKSFLAMELCTAVSNGGDWLKFHCIKGQALYVNLELQGESCEARFHDIYKAAGVPNKESVSVQIWNLRGHTKPLDKLAPALIDRAKGMDYDLIIIDPLYKVLIGDENSATEMAKFCRQWDIICEKTGAAVVMFHHHSKGIQGGKMAHDRASGSGVLARDPDAILDIIELDLSKLRKENADKIKGTAWKMEGSLREFPDFEPFNFWFKYPIHFLDTDGVLDEAYAPGSRAGNLAKSGKRQDTVTKDKLIEAYNTLKGFDEDKPVKTKDIADYLQKTTQCISSHLRDNPETFEVNRGVVIMRAKEKG